MKKITAFIGCASKTHTHYAVNRFLESLRSFGDFESETVVLSDYNVRTCRGCKTCFARGEEFCPLKDDRDVLIGTMMSSDGVIFATPNYSYQVSAIMKTFLDRLGFVFHRPRFFGRTFTSIVVQGIYGGDKIVKYLDFVGMGLGFNVVKGSCVTALDPMSVKEQRAVDGVLDAHSRRFHEQLERPAYPVPSLLKVCAFRYARTRMRLQLGDKDLDYRYYRDKGWFASDYFYPARLNPFKKAVGSLTDFATSRCVEKPSGAPSEAHPQHR